MDKYLTCLRFISCGRQSYWSGVTAKFWCGCGYGRWQMRKRMRNRRGVSTYIVFQEGTFWGGNTFLVFVSVTCFMFNSCFKLRQLQRWSEWSKHKNYIFVGHPRHFGASLVFFIGLNGLPYLVIHQLQGWFYQLRTAYFARQYWIEDRLKLTRDRCSH